MPSTNQRRKTIKIPQKIKIGGHWLDIKYRNEKEGFDRTGLKLGWNNSIIIQKDMEHSKQISALLHEIFHELSYQLDMDLDEKQACCLAEGMYQVLVDNKFI